MKCPHCHNSLVINIQKSVATFGPAWRGGRSHTFEQTTQPWQPSPSSDLGSNVEATRIQPARAASVESDVIVPLCQSLTTGAAVLVPAIGAAVWLEWSWYAPLVISGGTVTMTWLLLLGAHRKLLWIVETISQLGEEDAPAEPKSAAIQLEVKHTEPSGRIGRMQFIDLPKKVTQKMLIEWSKSVTNDTGSIAQDAWCGKGKLFSKPVYIDFIAAMNDAGILALKGADKSQGYRLTTGGRHSLKRMISAE